MNFQTHIQTKNGGIEGAGVTISKSMAKQAGRLSVASALTLRGYIPTLIDEEYTKEADISVHNPVDYNQFLIRVQAKATNGHYFRVNRNYGLRTSENLYYVFVSLLGEATRAHRFLVPSAEVAAYLLRSDKGNSFRAHKRWLEAWDQLPAINN